MNSHLRVSSNGLDIIKEFEGLRLNAYQDSVGVWTIGYGHTKSVYPGMSITHQEAEALLRQDVAEHAVGIYETVTVPLNQNQFDALASFVFNLGRYILHDSRLLQYINSRQWYASAEKMKLYNKAGGQTLPGLVRRRNMEAELFLKAGSGNNQAPSNPPYSPINGIVRSYPESGTFTPNTTINIRTKPNTNAQVTGQYHSGESLNYHTVHIGNGHVWLEYTSYSGSKRYVACRTYWNGSYGPLWGTID